MMAKITFYCNYTCLYPTQKMLFHIGSSNDEEHKDKYNEEYIYIKKRVTVEVTKVKNWKKNGGDSRQVLLL